MNLYYYVCILLYDLTETNEQNRTSRFFAKKIVVFKYNFQAYSTFAQYFILISKLLKYMYTNVAVVNRLYMGAGQ